MKKRIWELDFLRGFAIIMMIFDHMMYDLMYMDVYFYNFSARNLATFNWLNDIATRYWASELRMFGHVFFISVFLLVSGISYTFSRNNLLRASRFVIVALLITLATYLIQITTGQRMLIIFGIIHMYAFSTLITFLFRRLWNDDRFIFVVASIIIAIGIYNRFWILPEFADTFSLKILPQMLYGSKGFGADYFALIPYTGIIMLGTVIGNIYYKNRTSLVPSVKISEKNIVMFAGRKSLIIFLTHQFVLFGLLYIIGLIFGYRM